MLGHHETFHLSSAVVYIVIWIVGAQGKRSQWYSLIFNRFCSYVPVKYSYYEKTFSFFSFFYFHDYVWIPLTLVTVCMTLYNTMPAQEFPSFDCLILEILMTHVTDEFKIASKMHPVKGKSWWTVTGTSTSSKCCHQLFFVYVSFKLITRNIIVSLNIVKLFPCGLFSSLSRTVIKVIWFCANIWWTYQHYNFLSDFKGLQK